MRKLDKSFPFLLVFLTLSLAYLMQFLRIGKKKSQNGSLREELPSSTIKNRVDFSCTGFNSKKIHSKGEAVAESVKLWSSGFPNFWDNYGNKNPAYNQICNILLAHSMVETDNFKSSLYKRASNMFGMRVPLMRKNTLAFQTNGYAGFDCDMSSVWDLLLWFRAKNYPVNNWRSDMLTPEGYVRYIKQKGYFEAKESDYLKNFELRYNSLPYRFTLA